MFPEPLRLSAAGEYSPSVDIDQEPGRIGVANTLQRVVRTLSVHVRDFTRMGP